MTLPITFQHCTAQVVVNVVNKSSNVVEWINFAMIQQPDTTGLRWDLYTGRIFDQKATSDQPATALSMDKINMPASGLMCSQYLLPLQYEGNLELYLDLKMNGSTQTKGFTCNLPIPNNELQAGNSYHYKVYFDIDTVYVGNVNINDWTVVDLEGNPLYPSIIFD